MKKHTCSQGCGKIGMFVQCWWECHIEQLLLFPPGIGSDAGGTLGDAACVYFLVQVVTWIFALLLSLTAGEELDCSRLLYKAVVWKKQLMVCWKPHSVPPKQLWDFSFPFSLVGFSLPHANLASQALGEEVGEATRPLTCLSSN